MTNPGYVVLVLAHALCGLIGFGALATTGAYAEAVRRHADPFSSASLRRFFKPGHNLASATILAVPFLGGGLLLAQHGKDVHLLYPWLGLGLWSFAVTTALVVCGPRKSGCSAFSQPMKGPLVGSVIVHQRSSRLLRGAVAPGRR